MQRSPGREEAPVTSTTRSDSQTEASCPRGSLLTADDVAEFLGVPVSWVYQQSRVGRIPTVTLGRYRRYRREAIEAWLERLEDSGTNGSGARPVK